MTPEELLDRKRKEAPCGHSMSRSHCIDGYPLHVCKDNHACPGWNPTAWDAFVSSELERLEGERDEVGEENRTLRFRLGQARKDRRQWLTGLRQIKARLARAEATITQLTKERDEARSDAIWLDFPCAWEVQKEPIDPLDHDPACSAETTNGAMLCDNFCGAVFREWKKNWPHYFKRLRTTITQKDRELEELRQALRWLIGMRPYPSAECWDGAEVVLNSSPSTPASDTEGEGK
jgi:hypothetical protein